MASRNGLDSLVRPEDSVLVLIDHQPYQLTNLNSHDPQAVVNNSTALAKSAKAFAIQRMIAAGANVMTWLAVAAEWQRDWARTEHAAELIEILKQHAAGSGIAYLWEQQLLNTPVPSTEG